MERIEDTFLDTLEGVVPLSEKRVLEIGCGGGEQSEKIALRAKYLTGVDPDSHRIADAQKKSISNAAFHHASIPGLSISKDVYDVVIFTLSLHHIPREKMSEAISEALSLVKPEGYIVFLEPGFIGSYFEAEIKFDAGDGNESEAKESAALAMMRHRNMKIVTQFEDHTSFQVNSVDDFVASMKPKKRLDEIESFLQREGMILKAQRWITVFRPV